MIRWKTGFAAVAVLAFASMASAATMSLTPVVQATYDATTGALVGNSYIRDNTPHIYRVALMAGVGALGANESFGLVGYDIGLQPGLSRNTVSVGGAATGLTNPKPNFVADSPSTSLIISSSGQTLTNYYTGGQNGDLGSSTTDLVGLLTAIDASNLDGLEDDQGVHATDPRLAIGTAVGGTRVGVVYVKWDGTTTALFSVLNGLGSTANKSTKLFSNTFAIAQGEGVNSFKFQAVPEPASIALMGLAGLGTVLLARRRRTA